MIELHVKAVISGMALEYLSDVPVSHFSQNIRQSLGNAPFFRTLVEMSAEMSSSFTLGSPTPRETTKSGFSVNGNAAAVLIIAERSGSFSRGPAS